MRNERTRVHVCACEIVRLSYILDKLYNEMGLIGDF